MVMTKKDKANLKNAILLVLAEMQKDAVSAIMYNGNEFGVAVANKIEEYQNLLYRLELAETC
jgi:hypothetical protein